MDLDVVSALQRGLVVVIPTDTVYGLAVDPTVPGATQRLFDLKGRDRVIPIAVLVGSLVQAWSIVADPVPPSARSLAARWWPGPLTLVVPRRPSWTADLGAASSTVGVRWPQSPLVAEWCQAVGPLATTSANVHGGPTPASLAAVLDVFASGVSAAIDGGELVGQPSTVVDCTVMPPRVLREGAIHL